MKCYQLITVILKRALVDVSLGACGHGAAKALTGQLTAEGLVNS